MAFRAKYFREQEKRVFSAKVELKRKFWRSIVINQTLPLSVRFKFYKKLRASRLNSFVKVKNRCIFTNRAKSVIRVFQMSRIVFREFARAGVLVGVRKSSW